MVKKYFLAWFPMVFLAIINGVFRQVAYRSLVDELTAHQLSTVTAIIITGVYIWLISQQWPLSSASQALVVGFMWLGMTILFECGFGHYIMKNSWSKLLADYNIFAGRMWVLFLAWITVAPYLFYAMGRKKR